ncbi:unnamed protein product [Colias eurytheme]|nr:unnamed protein product [Colias eurytheme]
MDRLKRKKYTAHQLDAALMAITNGASVYETSKKFGIPRTTLRDKRDNKYSNEKCGVQTVFTKDEERQLIDWIHYLGRLGFPVTKDQLLETVSKLVETLNRPNPFKDGVPGRHWFQNFLKRHPTISRRVAQNLPTNRNEVKEEAIRLWFGRVRQYFEENNLIDLLDDPARIFNCDETGFFLCPKAKQVIVQRGSKKVYTRVANDEKECLTVLVNVAADGKVAPPMVLYPYKRMPKNLVPTVPSGWAVEQTIVNGFRSCGIYHFETNNVNYIKLLPEIRNVTSDTNSDTAEGSDSNTARSIHGQCQPTNHMKTFKQLFEDRLSPTVLQEFKSSGNIWIGDISYKKLFEYWKNIKSNDDDDERNLEIGDTTLVNNFADGTDLDILTFEVTPALNLQSEQNVSQEISYLTVDGTLTLPVDHVSHENTQGPVTSHVTNSMQKSPFNEFRINKDFIFNTADQNLRTISPKPSILTSTSATPPPKPSTSTPKPSIPTPTPATSSPKAVTSTPKSSTSTPKLSTINPKPSTSSIQSTCVSLSFESLDNTIINRSEYCKTPLKSNTTSISKNIPKELNISTPFKNALYFPESKASTKKRACRRVTPTVAISDEFMAYQKNIEAEKLEKEEKKRKRNEDSEKKKEDKLLSKKGNPKSKLLNKAKRKIAKVDASKEDATDSENDFQDRHVPQRRNKNLQPFSELSFESALRFNQASPYRDTATSRDVNLCNYVSSSDDCEINRPAKIIMRPRHDFGFDSESDESIF